MTSKNVGSKRSGYWVWVTRPEFYLDEDGSERADLLPGDDWWDSVWTCHKDTKAGDQVLVYRTSPRKDIAYLFSAMSDAEAYSALPSEHEIFKGAYVCEWSSVWKFENPLSLSQMRSDPELVNSFGALRGNFQKRAFEVSKDAWSCLVELLAATNEGFSESVAKKVVAKVAKNQVLERDIEERLADNLSVLPSSVGRLKLIQRQRICGAIGRADLLCRGRAGITVIEIKRGSADRNTFGQISSYVGWVKKNYPNPGHVRGLVVARGKSHDFQAALDSTEDIRYVDLVDIADELGLKI